MSVPVFCCFLFQKSCSENILGIGRNKSPGPYFSITYTEFEGETKRGTEPTSPYGGAAPLLAPRVPTDAAPSPINSYFWENPRHPSHVPRKVPEPPPPSTLTRGGSEALPGTLPESGIITGGLYIAMPASGVMRE